jgi:FAD/FMN-containing dehydrogenase
MPGAAAIDALRAAVGDAHTITDPDLLAVHCTDWTGRWTGEAAAAVRPATTDEVRQVVLAARAHRVPLVPQGGNTGLVGGAVPRGEAVVVDLRRLSHLEAVDVVAGQVTAGAGATLGSLQEHAAPHGLELAVDLGARDTATIGGMVATNAGGTHVLRHGAMRAQVLGVEAVLGNGQVVRANLDGLLKDNTGYDLPGLLCGSEGTLAIVTRARVRLVPVPRARVVALVGFPSVDAAVAGLPALRGRASVRAVEVMLAHGMEVVAEHIGVPLPFSAAPPAVLLVEVVGDDPLPELGSLLESLAIDEQDAVVGADERTAAGLWRWREAHPEAAAAHGVVHKADVTLPAGALADFAAEVAGAVDAVAPGSLVLVYGHLADGNLHVNIVGPDASDERPVDAVLELVLRHHGSVSAEHGIGIAKRHWLERQRGAEAVAAMRALKAAWDPDGILNPGVLLP